MAAYPLFFTFRDIKRTVQFVVGIEICGRLLIEERDGDWWMVAAEPGGFSERGATIPEAFQAFRAAYVEVLDDVVAESRNLDRLIAALNEFVSDGNTPATERWEDARGQLRAGLLVPPPELAGLNRDTATKETYLSIFDCSVRPPAVLVFENEIQTATAPPANADYLATLGQPYPKLAA